MSINTSPELAPRRAYARLWRWHFYAAFLVIPFVLWQGGTGVLYLWHQEIADVLWPQLRFVAESASACISRRAGRTSRIRRCCMGRRRARLIKLPAAPDRSTELVFAQATV